MGRTNRVCRVRHFDEQRQIATVTEEETGQTILVRPNDWRKAVHELGQGRLHFDRRKQSTARKLVSGQQLILRLPKKHSGMPVACCWDWLPIAHDAKPQCYRPPPARRRAS